jgi:hypothetical protein
LRNDRIDAPCLFDGPINGERFHAYVEQFLVPTLKPCDVVILAQYPPPSAPRISGTQDTRRPKNKALWIELTAHVSSSL